MTAPRYPIAQVAYHVRDVESAVAHAVTTFGAGPFFLSENIRLARAEHLGEPCSFVHTSAYGQWGGVMMELVQQDDDGPSPFREVFPDGGEGLHHVATIVDDFDAAVAHYAEHGCPVMTKATTEGGTDFWFLDARACYGHLIEIYERSEGLIGFYDMVAQAADGWRGEAPLRKISI